MDRFGGLIIDRTINYTYLQSSFDPQLPLTPNSVQSGLTYESLISRNLGKGSSSASMQDIDKSEELMLRPIQDKLYKDLYVFSDNEDTLDDLDKRYKVLCSGFKSFGRQKRKQNVGGSETIEY
jgi:hypothetical protein